MRTQTLVVVISTVLATAPLTIHAQKGDLTHEHAATQDASVDFGVLPTAPLGPLPCLQSGAIGGPADPCAYKLHHLTPEETTILKDGQVTFQIHGGGHGMAIYEVSKDTTRDELGQFLCAGDDPSTIANPANHVCDLSATNAAAAHNIADGHGDVVIVASPNVTNAHPDNRVWSEPGRLMSAGGRSSSTVGRFRRERPPTVSSSRTGFSRRDGISSSASTAHTSSTIGCSAS
jgi:hypothetical protein